MLEESSRPPAPLGTQTSDVTLDSPLPCIVSWWCHPTEPGETSQSSREPSSRAAATLEAHGEVARATTGEGVHAMASPPKRWTLCFSMGVRGGESPMLADALAIRAF